MPAEADVREPWPARRPDAQYKVVVRDPGPVGAEHAGGEQVDLVTERAQEHGESTVELVTEAAPPGADDLVQQWLLREHDLFAEVDGEVLEGDATQMAEVQRMQRVGIGGPGAGDADPGEVGLSDVYKRQAMVCAASSRRQASSALRIAVEIPQGRPDSLPEASAPAPR